MWLSSRRLLISLWVLHARGTITYVAVGAVDGRLIHRMPRDVSLVDTNGVGIVSVEYSGFKSRTLSAFFGTRLMRSIHDSASRMICCTANPLELRLRNVLQSMVDLHRGHILPVMNVIAWGQMVIKNGVVVPEGERITMTKKQFNEVVSLRVLVLPCFPTHASSSTPRHPERDGFLES